MTTKTIEDLQSALLAQTVINDPFSGEISAAAFKEGSMLWPGGNWARVEHFHTTEADGRTVVEVRCYKDAASDEFLPIGFVFDPVAEAGPTAYVYSDHHLVEDRGRIHEPVPGLHPWRDEEDVLYNYFQVLGQNKIDEVLAHFAEDGYFQHSNGSVHLGYDALREDFEKMLEGGGIRIDYCRLTDDGETCVVEAYMPSGRPSICVYERAGPALKAARMYL
jgi:hypothetical protein